VPARSSIKGKIKALLTKKGVEQLMMRIAEVNEFI
jgi:hypothetical protein